MFYLLFTPSAAKKYALFLRVKQHRWKGSGIMATVTYISRKGQPLTEEERDELRNLKNRPILFDEDCPELTYEQLKEFRRVNPRRTEQSTNLTA